VIGITRSANFPTTTHALSVSHSLASPPACDEASNDVFVTKLPSDLQSALVYSSYVNRVGPLATLAADEREEPAGLAISAGNLIISGETESPDMPVTGNAFDTTISTEVAGCTSGGFRDCFVIKLFPGVAAGSVLHYGSFFGGDDSAIGCPGSPSENGSRGRSVLVGDWDWHRGLVIFSGVTNMEDYPTTAGVLFPTWLSGDARAGFVAIHNVGD
jgi:hypothetical protein